MNQDVITLPPERTKNNLEHLVPMSAPVRAILEARPEFDGRDLVFGRGHGGFLGWSACKERIDDALPAGVAQGPWTLHDFRRTMSTMMHDSPEDGGLGIAPHVVEAVINHVSGHKRGVAGVYNKAAYLSEKRQALALWADRLMAIVEDRATNVVVFKSA
jgi:integrase